jgi:hypothetical protein
MNTETAAQDWAAVNMGRYLSLARAGRVWRRAMSFICYLLKQIACQDVSATELTVAPSYDGARPHQCGAAVGTLGGLMDRPSWWHNRDQCVLPRTGNTCYDTGVKCTGTHRANHRSFIQVNVLPASHSCSARPCDCSRLSTLLRCTRTIAFDRHNLPPHPHGPGIDAGAIVVGVLLTVCLVKSMIVQHECVSIDHKSNVATSLELSA